MEKIKIGCYRPEQPNRKRVAIRKEGEERAATQSEYEQFRSVNGSLIWLSRVCRPDVSYRVSSLQQRLKGLKVADLQESNKVIAYAKEDPDKGLTFRSGVIDWKSMCVGTVTDASHAEEHEWVERMEALEPYRSQGGRLNILATSELESGEQCHFHLISWSSHVIKRVVRSTLQGESYALQNGVESGDIIRAAIAYMYGVIGRDWEADAAAFMKHVWVSDCESVVSALQRPVLGKIQDKRLGIELAAMRQSLWRTPGTAKGDPRMDDEKPTDVTDIVYWVDTDVMLADPLTKKMDAKKMWDALDSNYWDMKQPIESLRKKRLKQEQRRKTTQFTEEEKYEMKSKWQKHERTIFTNKFMHQLRGGPQWDAVVWREIYDVDENIMLEDKPKEMISKKDVNRTLGKKMNLRITLYTDDADSHLEPSSGHGDVHQRPDEVSDDEGH